MTSKKKIDIEGIILSLLNEQNEINIHAVAKVTGLSAEDYANRRAIQRAFKNLLEQNAIEMHGKARARVYTLSHIISPLTESIGKQEFSGIPLSRESEILLRFMSQPIQARIPVGYNQDFLRSYRPNRTFYLSESVRAELFKAGQVEDRTWPAGTYARNILNRLLIDLSWNSSRLEGNTYSLLETKRLIEIGENATGKDASEAQMILNHKEAIEYIIESAAEKEIDSHQIYSIHALLSENLLGDASASGRIRQILVGISGTTYIPLENPLVLKECFHLFIDILNKIEDPFEQSFFSIIHLSYLQAFEDVNKRTARLVANIPMIKKNLNPLSFADVDRDAYITSLMGVYEKNDISLMLDLYLWAYKRSAQRYSAIQQSMGKPNLLKLKYRNVIQEIIRAIVLGKIPGSQVVHEIRNLLQNHDVPQSEAGELFQTIEADLISLHDGNIARFKIRPSEFSEWMKFQLR